MNRVAVVGDVHGCLKEFLALVKKLPADIEQIYTVGDLIDRGPNSKEVIQECIDRGIICVKGNHESMFLSYIRETNEYDRGIFEMNGGLTTLRSYKNDLPDTKVNGGVTTLTSYKDGIPNSHLEFMMNMPYYIETDDFILSHAGIASHIEKTFRDCSARSQSELMWDRTSKAKDLGKLQVFGHTPNKEVQFLEKWNALDEKHDIVGVNVDTCCFHTGVLSAVLIPSLEIIQT